MFNEYFINLLHIIFLEQRKNREYDKEALEVTGELLGANPDFNTLWNFRREVLAYMKEEGSVFVPIAK